MQAAAQYNNSMDLAESHGDTMLQLTAHQQGQVNWLRGKIEHLGEDKYRLTTDYRENSPSYKFTEAELVDILEKAGEDYADWDESQ